jgi:hypothetical protein
VAVALVAMCPSGRRFACPLLATSPDRDWPARFRFGPTASGRRMNSLTFLISARSPQ